MQRRNLTDPELRDWLRLSRSENVSPITFRHLINRFGSAAVALDALPEIAMRTGKRVLHVVSAMKIEDEIARTQKSGGKIIALCEPDYPEGLAAIEDAPPIITALGQADLLHKRSIGIVGARNASLSGRKLAGTLARELGKDGITIVSGLARGIDTAAHQSSKTTGTIAVLAGGADVVYPEENRALYEHILEAGCVVSDQPLGSEPYAKLFPRRNRLISGLSLGVVVIEAAMQSGSLITARIARQQGRLVFAVSGSPLDPRTEGANDLIRQGAILVEKPADVLDHVHRLPKLKGVASEPAPETTISAYDENELPIARVIIFEFLSPSPTSIDDLIRRSGLSPSAVLTVLLELELAGRVERQAGHKVLLIGDFDDHSSWLEPHSIPA